MISTGTRGGILKNHFIHPDVVRLGKGVWDELEREADAELECIWAGVGEHAVVKPTTAAEATATWIEGKPGAEESIDLADRDFRRVGVGFEDAERARDEISSGMEAQVVAGDFRINPSQVGAGVDGF